MNSYFLNRQTYFSLRFFRQMRLEAELGLSLNDLLFRNRLIRKVFHTRSISYSMKTLDISSNLVPFQYWLDFDRKLREQRRSKILSKSEIRRRLVSMIFNFLKTSKISFTKLEIARIFRLYKYMPSKKRKNVLSVRKVLNSERVIQIFSDFVVSNTFMDKLNLPYKS